MEQSNIEKIGVLIQRWGIPMQLVIATEEASEIQKVYCKLLRGYGLPREILIDALADNYIMLQTVVQMYGFTGEEIEAVVNRKLEKALQVPNTPPPQPNPPQLNEKPTEEPQKEVPNIDVKTEETVEK